MKALAIFMVAMLVLSIAASSVAGEDPKYLCFVVLHHRDDAQGKKIGSEVDCNRAERVKKDNGCYYAIFYLVDGTTVERPIGRAFGTDDMIVSAYKAELKNAETGEYKPAVRVGGPWQISKVK